MALTYIYQQSSRGILVTINNNSDINLQDAQISLNHHGESFIIGNIGAHSTSRTRVQAGGESTAHLLFRTPTGEEFTALIIGYFESGYCGKVDVTIGSDLRVEAFEKIKVAICY
jgi:hypothetical protein